jgi:protochlorophyllide reductase
MKLSTAIAAILPLSAAAFAPASFHATKSKTSLNLRPIASNNESVTSTTTLNALTTTELPDKLYIPQGKEVPKVLGGLKIGTRKLCVVTGASSGLGLNASASLAKTGRHFVVMACRDVEKGKRGEFLFEIDPN